MLTVKNWANWVLATIVAAVLTTSVLPFLLPQLRSFVKPLPDHNQLVILNLLCFVYVFLVHRLLRVRLGQLRSFFFCPPIWSGWVTGTLLAFGADLWLTPKYNPDLYRMYIHWTLAVLLFDWLMALRKQSRVSSAAPVFDIPSNIEIQAVANQHATLSGDAWGQFETWLMSPGPANSDFLGIGLSSASERLATIIISGKTVGIVGRFGSGKSTLVNCLIHRARLALGGNRLIHSCHSCWGFESSGVSIQAILEDAVEQVRNHVDVFSVRGLPDSYRKALHGNAIAEAVSETVLPQADWTNQVEVLSNLLGLARLQLVITVEDLDRNNSSQFDIQEVLAFLYQLKGHANISVILTGGIDPKKKIDYTKLCDHIEYMPQLSELVVSNALKVLYVRCHDLGVFPHVSLSSDPPLVLDYSYVTVFDLGDPEDTEAIVRLLQSPRELKLALNRTYQSWQRLYGEVNWEDLLLINVLRYSAPESVDFLIRQWKRLSESPQTAAFFHASQVEAVRASLKADWESTTKHAEWNVTAAKTLLDRLLPQTSHWLSDGYTGTQRPDQSITREVYWHRALTEYLDVTEVRDQVVINAIDAWLAGLQSDAPRRSDSENDDHITLPEQLTFTPGVAEAWERVARIRMSSRPEDVFRLGLELIRLWNKVDGTGREKVSFPLDNVKRFAIKYISLDPTNTRFLNEYIREAFNGDLRLVKYIWSEWCDGNSTLVREDLEPTYALVVEELRKHFTLDEVGRLMVPDHSHILASLLFAPVNGKFELSKRLAQWRWLRSLDFSSFISKSNLVLGAFRGIVLACHESTGSAKDTADILYQLFGSETHKFLNSLKQDNEQSEFAQLHHKVIEQLTPSRVQGSELVPAPTYDSQFQALPSSLQSNKRVRGRHRFGSAAMRNRFRKRIL